MGFGAAAGIILALVPVVRGNIDVSEPLRKLQGKPAVPEPPSFAGLDLMRLDVRPSKVTAPLSDGRRAELTLDPVIQRAVRAEMETYRIPRAGVVMMEVKTGRVLAYASYVAEGEKVDVNVRAEAPAASVFKIVTGAALVEKAGLGAETEQCYHGGRSRIQADELVDNPRRDKWCATLGIAMGRSINVVFARLTQKHITPEDLAAVGGAFGFGAPVPFVVENQAPEIKMPADPLPHAAGPPDRRPRRLPRQPVEPAVGERRPGSGVRNAGGSDRDRGARTARGPLRRLGQPDQPRVHARRARRTRARDRAARRRPAQVDGRRPARRGGDRL
jgi:hypothetical protein